MGANSNTQAFLSEGGGCKASYRSGNGHVSWEKIISVWLKAGIFFRAQRSMFLISAAEIGFRNGFDPAVEWSGKGNWSYSGVRLFPPNWQSILQLKTVVSSIIIDSVCPSLLFLMEYLTSVIF